MSPEAWKKKVMGKIFLPEDREFLQSLTIEKENILYIDSSKMDKKQRKRLKGLAKIIQANRKSIRLPLLIVLLVITGTLAVWQIFLKDQTLTRLAEDQLEKVFQAQVDVKNLKVSLFKGSLSVSELVIADKNHPMQNLVEMKNIKASLDTRQLTLGRLHIQELGFSDLQRATARESSGALERMDAPEPLPETSEPAGTGIIDQISASLGQIDPMDILEQEMQNLESPALIEETQDTYNEYLEYWEEEFQYWESKEQEWKESASFIRSINVRSFNSLEAASATLTRLERISTSAQADISKANSTYSKAESQWKETQRLYGKVQESIRADYRYLEGLVKMSAGEKLDWVSGILDEQMGSSISRYLSYLRQGREWYERLQKTSGDKESEPSRKREGRRLPENSDNPPFFLLYHAYASGVENEFSFDAEIFNVTNAPDRWAEPAQLRFDWESPQTGPAMSRISMEDAEVDFPELAFDLGDSLNSLGLSSLSGGMSLQASLTTEDQSTIGILEMHIPQFLVEQSNNDFLSRTLASTLKDAEDIEITGEFQWMDDQLTMEFESDLNRLLNQALGNLLLETSKEGARLLKEYFGDELEGPMQEMENSLSSLGLNMNEVEDLQDAAGSLQSQAEQKKKELEDSIRNQVEEQIEEQAGELLEDGLNNLRGFF